MSNDSSFLLLLQIQRRKAEKQNEEVAGVTFHPEISRLAQNLWTPQECASVPAWQRLSKGTSKPVQGNHAQHCH